MEKENEEARRAARRLEKERRRLEMGSDYEMSEDEEEADNQGNSPGQRSNGKKKDEYDSDEDVRDNLIIAVSMILKMIRNRLASSEKKKIPLYCHLTL